LRRAVRAAAPDQPLRVAELEVLAAVVEQPGVPPGEVARRLYLAHNSVSTLVRTLVAAGMLQRVPQAGDRRRARLLPTAHGRRTLRRWQRTNQQVLAVAMAALAPADRRTLAAAVGALDRLVDRIDTTAAGPALQLTRAPRPGSPRHEGVLLDSSEPSRPVGTPL
ncbi:MAG: MarR family winged helix-turn-helix transcriptional regulator, partial [Actinomycetota bacterium]